MTRRLSSRHRGRTRSFEDRAFHPLTTRQPLHLGEVVGAAEVGQLPPVVVHYRDKQPRAVGI